MQNGLIDKHKDILELKEKLIDAVYILVGSTLRGHVIKREMCQDFLIEGIKHLAMDCIGETCPGQTRALIKVFED